MTYSDNTYITAQDLSFAGLLRRGDVKKLRVALQPIFEAFTNALEAIKIRERKVFKPCKQRTDIPVYAGSVILVRHIQEIQIYFIHYGNH